MYLIRLEVTQFDMFVSIDNKISNINPYRTVVLRNRFYSDN